MTSSHSHSHSHISQPNLCFILLCSGNGADSTSYKPNRDETQWWQRRDALVRCTSAALFSSMFHHIHNNNNDDVTKTTNTELILLFDGDGAQMHMQVVSSHSNDDRNDNDNDMLFIPSEQNLIQLWKRASARPNTEIVIGCLSCTCRTVIHDENKNKTGKRMRMSKNKSNCSKRELLSEIRYRLASNKFITYEESLSCSYNANADNDHNNNNDMHMIFLRKWHLNASDDVVLRKVNREKLLLAWNDLITMTTWKKNCTLIKHEYEKPFERSLTEEESTFSRVLQSHVSFDKRLKQRSKRNNSNSEPNTLAIFLHETSKEELPCFGLQLHEVAENNYRPDQIFIFLGAVRDMTNNEYLALSAACDKLDIPLCGCNLGKTAEFTSKIIMTMISHQAVGRLGIAVALLWKRAAASNNLGVQAITSEKDHATSIIKGTPKSKARGHFRSESTKVVLHFVCLIPMSSQELSVDLSKRSITYSWHMIRSCVCALWRSRLASSCSTDDNTDNDNFQNELSIIFDDGVCLFFEQKDLVKNLAEKHQAAPTEYQVLSTLCTKRNEETMKRLKKLDWMSKLFPSYKVNDIVSFKIRKIFCANRIPRGDETSSVEDFIASFYAAPCFCAKHHRPLGSSAYISFVFDVDTLPIIRLSNMDARSSLVTKEKLKKARKKIIRVAQEEGIATSTLCFGSKGVIFGVDVVASFITMMQHFHYHGVLLGTLSKFKT